MMMQLRQAQEMLSAQGVDSTLVGVGRLPLRRIHTDTRTVEAGDLFLALRGERFDGHDFLTKAREAGVTAVIAEEGIAAAGLSGLLVKDSRKALGALAAAWRRQFRLPLIAVTGSNGKTTVTQMIAGMLRAWHGSDSLATRGNFNNDIGVPLTLFGLNRKHRSAVLELGMNHPGEIAALAAYAQPTVAVVNNAQREHQEFMHTVDAVAQENGAAISALPADGVAVFPGNSQYAAVWRSMAGARRCLTFGLTRHGEADTAVDVSASAQWRHGSWQLQVYTPAGAFAAQLNVAGLHNVKNALAAVAAALSAGAPLPAIARGLQAFRPVKGRSQTLQLNLPDWQVTVVDDTYNANPDSMCAAVDVLSELPGPHLLILGDMGEVGEEAEDLHAELGEYAMDKGIETLYCTGELMRYCAAVFPDARHFGSMPALMQKCEKQLRSYRSILVKGSRFMGMERVVAHLAKAAQQQVAQRQRELQLAAAAVPAPALSGEPLAAGGATAAAGADDVSVCVADGGGTGGVSAGVHYVA